MSSKRKAIITSAALIFIVSLIVVITALSTKTGVNESHFSEGTTADGRLSYTLPEDFTVQSEESLSIAKPESLNTSSAESKFTFSGKCDGKYELFCNGTPIPYSDMGVFSFEVNLVQGVNSFEIKYGSVTKTYTVEYGIDIIRQISPQGKTEVSAGSSVEILALAHKDAVLTASIGSLSVKMAATDRNAFQQSEGTKDYITFAGSIVLPSSSSNQLIGVVTVSGTLSDKTASMTGGEVYIIADNSAIIAKAAKLEQLQNLTSFYSSGTYGLKTPYYNNGLGTALMCEVLKDKTETTPASSTNDYSDPLFTPLPKGTFDYVSGIVTYDDELMYILSSGRKIYAKDAKLLSPGYVLPSNTVSASEIVINNSTTDFYIKTDWMVPVSACLSPQAYSSGYQGRVYNVSAFTAQYLDIVFYHTSSAGENFNLPVIDVFSSVQWINNGNGSVTLRCVLSSPGKFYGYSISLSNDGRIKLSVKNKNSASGKTVIIDPGHGGSDPGAPGAYNGIYESPVNLIIAQKVAAVLQERGVNVILSRTDESDVTLNDRMLMARQYMPDAFVSIHSDSSTSASSSGTHTFYYESFSMPLASAIHNQMVSVYRNNIYYPGTAEHKNADKGIHFYPFQVTRVEECPSVLVECGYLSNATDCSILLTEGCQNALATAIANGIIIYFNETA